MKTIFLWFKKQGERLENNQERVKDEVTRVAAILAIIIFSPLLIIVLIILLIMSVDLENFCLGLKRIFKKRILLREKKKEFLKKFIKRLKQCAKEIAFYCNFTNLPMSEEDMKEFLKIDKYEE